MTGRGERIAVADLGKTNTKLMVLDATGAPLWEIRRKPNWIGYGDLRVLDDVALTDWIVEGLKAAVGEHGAESLMFSTHGCTFALAGEEELAHPILDYEQEPPATISARIDPLLPDFSETYTPLLPLGLNYARHILWLQERDPDLVGRSEAILSYPQFWSWRFSGRKVAEISYAGCHSCIWAPLKDDYSSLVDSQNWRPKMPEFAGAGEVLGSFDLKLPDGTARSIDIHNGVHDSNAALAYYRAAGHEDFTLVSTGTWVVIMNLACPLERLDPDRDMLANMAVDRRPAPTIKFMGGREFDVAADGWNRPISVEALEAVITRRTFALPSFAAGGPFPNWTGRFTGPETEGEERAACALLYVAMMTDLSLDLIGSTGSIIVDGGLVRSDHFAPLLAAMRPGQDIRVGLNPEGSACGAASLARLGKGLAALDAPIRPVRPAGLAGLDTYRREWRDLLGVEGARRQSMPGRN